MQTAEHEEEIEEPEHTLCPITLAMFRDPVKVASGFTYEREAILDWWRTRRCFLDPRTNQVCASDAVCPDWDMRIAVGRFLEEHPGYVPRGWDGRHLPRPLPSCPSSRQGAQRKPTHTGVFRHCFAWAELCVIVCLGMAYVVVPNILILRAQCSQQGPFTGTQQLRLLGELALSSQARETLHQQGELDGWLAWVRADIKSAETQQLGCRLMANFAVDKAKGTLITLWGGTELVLEAMKRHPGSVHVQRECSYAFRMLSAPESSMELLLTAMEKHPTTPDVQTNCAEALADLADKNVTSVASRGSRGMELVLGAMAGHPDSPELQRTCLRLLEALWRGAVKGKDPLVRSRAVMLVLRAMAEHPSSATLQETGASAVATLATGSAAHAGISAIQLVLIAVEKHPTSAKLQSASSRALTALAVRNAGFVTLALSKGGLEVLERAMRRYPQSLSAWVCKALGLLIPGADASRLAYPPSLVKLLKDTVQMYPNSDKIQLECKYALQFIS